MNLKIGPVPAAYATADGARGRKHLSSRADLDEIRELLVSFAGVGICLMKTVFLSTVLGVTLASNAFASPITLTDSAVFSSNQFGENFNGWVWNTRGTGASDPVGRWNMYYSSSGDPDAPTFINSGDDTSAEISIDLGLGTHNFIVYGDQTGGPTDVTGLNFSINMSFNDMTEPHISGIAGPDIAGVVPNSHPNGLDYFGNSGQQGAGTLTYAVGGHSVTLTGFEWVADDTVDLVWPNFAGLFDGSGSGRPDWVGSITLEVTGDSTAIPLPATGWMLLAGLGALGIAARRRVS